jgi:hypothetical protein
MAPSRRLSTRREGAVHQACDRRSEAPASAAVRSPRLGARSPSSLVGGRSREGPTTRVYCAIRALLSVTSFSVCLGRGEPPPTANLYHRPDRETRQVGLQRSHKSEAGSERPAGCNRCAIDPERPFVVSSPGNRRSRPSSTA